ncbi:MAG TPA: ABC transporter permease [Xanthobacteraceae bacterium]|nr:ABC transporter permease [Xanthobacteraceae bacterium]
MDAPVRRRAWETPQPTPTGTVLAPAPGRFALSPLNRRRWENFKRNRRGYVSLWIFTVLFVLSLLANFIANDQPIYIRYEGNSYFPIFYTYPDTTFSEPGDTDALGTAADYRNDPDLIARIDKHGWIVWPPIRFSYDTRVTNPPSPFPSKPTWALTDEDCEAAAKGGFAKCDDKLESNWLGTDINGRDVVARLIYGFRISVLFGLTLSVLSSVVGVAAGAVQGYFGGWTDLLFQRVIEIWNSVPELYLLMILAAVLVPGFFILLGILLFFWWVRLVPLVRAEFLRGRNLEYINAARALGVSNAVIMLRHLLPNAMVATMTYLPFILSSAVQTLTALDFLGFGLPPGYPSLGELLNEGKANPSAWWLGLSGFFTIAIMLSLLIFIGEAVRDAFDPRKTFQAMR